ncbi:hypothetical protein ACX3X6_10285 [Pseudomonas sichuanensis]
MGSGLSDLMGWLREKSRMYSWDMIVAMDRDRLNRLLLHAYIGHFGNSSYFKPFTTTLEADSAAVRYLQDFVLDRPRLSFENADLSYSRASLNMRIISGNDVAVQQRAGGWEVSRLEWIEPMVGPLLELRLKLDEVETQIIDEVKLRLDLSKSEDFLLKFDADIGLQRLAGEDFAALFRKLPDEQRFFELGSIRRHPDSLLQPRSFRLATQPDKESQDANGAVLVFVSMQEGHNFDPPGEGSGFRYLIPKSYFNFSAIAMLSSWRLYIVWLLEALKKKLTTCGEPLFIGVGECERVSISDTSLFVPASEHRRRWKMYGEFFEIVLRHEEFTFFDAGELTVFQLGDRMLLSWPVTARFKYEYELNYDEPSAHGQGGVQMLGHDLSGLLEYTLSGALEVEIGLMEFPVVHYKVMRSEFKRGAQKGEAPLSWEEYFTLHGEHIQAIDPDAGDEWEKAMLLLYIIWLMTVGFKAVVDGIVESILLSLIDNITEVITSLPLRSEVLSQVRQVVTLNFGESFTGNQLFGPTDLVLFGQVQPRSSGMMIEPLEPRVVIGGECKFSANGVTTGPEWFVEPLEPGGVTKGHIERHSGLYKVPAETHFEGSYWRERIRMVFGGHTAWALVTVTRQALAIAPLVQLVPANGEVTLDAGTTEQAAFTWSIEGDAAGGKLSASTGPRVLFTAGAGNDDYPHLVRIKVSNQDEDRYASIISMAARPHLTLPIRVDNMDQARRQVTLKYPDDLRPGRKLVWEIVEGASSGTLQVSEDGQFLARLEIVEHPLDRYMVMGAEIRDVEESNPQVFMKGYFILPLPLHDYIDVYSRLQQTV